jgi:hypothetical protein
MDAEDFLRNSMTGKATLKSIRTEFKLAGSDYPLFEDTKAAYLDKINAAVEAMQARFGKPRGTSGSSGHACG